MAAKNSDMYKGKVILAPMVRIGTLPMRLLALEFGADLVYSEELIDWKLLRSKRTFNKALDTIDFIDETDGTVVFRTCYNEKGKNILQIGTCNPERALQAAKLMEDDVAGVDINMGCPKEFSIKGGMGAALLSQPEKAKKILSTLTSNLKIPVTCKVRVKEDEESTIEFCKELESCGISAIAVHGRTKNERPQHQNRNYLLKKISQSLTIPVIANVKILILCCAENVGVEPSFSWGGYITKNTPYVNEACSTCFEHHLKHDRSHLDETFFTLSECQLQTKSVEVNIQHRGNY